MNDTKNSTLVVIPRQFNGYERYLVYIAPKNKAFSGNYRFVGGKIKVDEDYVSTLKRELPEEYGVNISKINLLFKKKNVLGGEVFLCSGTIDGEPIKKEEDVGEPEWKSAEDLFKSSLVPNCKIALYCYLLKYNTERLSSLIPIIKNDKVFICFLSEEAEKLHSDLIERIRIYSK